MLFFWPGREVALRFWARRVGRMGVGGWLGCGFLVASICARLPASTRPAGTTHRSCPRAPPRSAARVPVPRGATVGGSRDFTTATQLPTGEVGRGNMTSPVYHRAGSYFPPMDVVAWRKTKGSRVITAVAGKKKHTVPSGRKGWKPVGVWCN